jgi:hypothetical protein
MIAFVAHQLGVPISTRPSGSCALGARRFPTIS